MVIIIDKEYIDGLKMCNQIEFLFDEKLNSCTFNFNIEEKSIEFYITMNNKIGMHQLNTALIVLNCNIRKLQRKEWSRFHKIHENKWCDNEWKTYYSYRLRCSKIINIIEEEFKATKTKVSFLETPKKQIFTVTSTRTVYTTIPENLL